MRARGSELLEAFSARDVWRFGLQQFAVRDFRVAGNEYHRLRVESASFVSRFETAREHSQQYRSDHSRRQ